MLDKSICKKCVNETSYKYVSSPWNTSDEVDWQRGEPSCRFDNRRIINKIPDDCPYLLEHLMKNQQLC